MLSIGARVALMWPLSILWKWLAVQDSDQIEELSKWRGLQKFPPGHFHSPQIGPGDLRGLARLPKKGSLASITGIDLRLDSQRELFSELSGHYAECPFATSREVNPRNRYFFENGFYSYADGIILYCLLRHLRPKRYIEVGSGYSSCLVLDVNELFLNRELSCTFIEPFPERLLENIRQGDNESVVLHKSKVQEVGIAPFESLDDGDILFVDSSHVSKFASDVNFLLFEVLPRLKPGVWIHFHDVFYPFEYPAEWLERGWSWNEAYLLRAFLSYNSNFEVKLWGDYLASADPGLVRNLMPDCLLNTGASIWMQKAFSP